MKYRICAIVAFTFCLVTLAKAGGLYEAVKTDTDLKTLVSRWANIDGKKIIWQTTGNASIKDANGLNEFAKLNQAKSFEEAFNRLTRELKLAHNDQGREHPPVPLTACIYEDAIVVQTIEQQDCSKSI